jgi:hypothetical protein
VHHALPLDRASEVSAVRDGLICDMGTGQADLELPLSRPLSSNNLKADAKCEMRNAPLILLCLKFRFGVARDLPEPTRTGLNSRHSSNRCYRSMYFDGVNC